VLTKKKSIDDVMSKLGCLFSVSALKSFKTRTEAAGKVTDGTNPALI
jgi:hypothetical protein